MLSLIIPAHNEAVMIQRTVRRATEAAQAWGGPFELIVVNDASTDATARLAAEAGARVVAVNHRHIAAVRNAGAAAAKGDRFVFLDADTVLPGATLIAAMRALDRGFVGGGAVVQFEDAATAFARWAVRIWTFLSRTQGWAAGAFIFCRRDVFESFGGFDERFFASEEVHFSIAMGRRGPVAIVSPPILTSARRERLNTVREQLGLMFCTLLTAGRTLQRRDALHNIWYNGRR